MRLIDADAYLEKMNGIYEEYFYDVLEEMPTIDAVSVVRCNDCKWYYPPFEIKGRRIEGECGFHAWYRADPTENDFCSRGERKDV